MGNLPSNTTEKSQHEVEDREFMRKTYMEDHGCWVNIGILHSFHSNRHIILNIVHDHGTSHITIYFPPITQEIFPLSLPGRSVWRVLVCLVNTNPGPETETDAFLT